MIGELEKEMINLESRLNQPDVDPALWGCMRQRRLCSKTCSSSGHGERMQGHGSGSFRGWTTAPQKRRGTRQQLLVLLEDLPHIGLKDAKRLNAPVTIEELTSILTCLEGQVSRAGLVDCEVLPGVLEVNYAQVLGKCLSAGELPLSWCRAVIVLLPKKEDLHSLKNWCLVTVLSTDYKIFTRVFSSLLASKLAGTIHSDQLYRVLGQRIHNINHLVLRRDPFMLTDRFRMQIITQIQILYTATDCLVKVNGPLLVHLCFGRGVHQACPCPISCIP
eukprot:g42535.t1